MSALFEVLRRLFGRSGSVEPLTGLDPRWTRVIVGLGNPGPEYAETRHNVGFRCVDALARWHAAGWQDKARSLSCRVAVINVPPTHPRLHGGLRPPTPPNDEPGQVHGGLRPPIAPNDEPGQVHGGLGPAIALNHGPGPVVLAKPTTFMNRSGTAVRELIRFLGLESHDVLVVYDDMDLPFGRLRLRERGSPGTHNGMRSIVTELHTEDVPRLRIGIGQAQPGEATSHVLSEFDPDQREEIDALIQRAAEAALAWAEMGAAAAMNRYNG